MPADDAVPTPADKATATAPARTMPTAVRVAVVVMSLLSGLLLLNALLTWVSRETVAKAIVAAGTGLSRAQAERYVVLWMLPYLILGLLLALSAWFLPRRLAWARLVGLGAAGLLCLITLFSAVSSRGITVASLLVLLLSMASVTSLLSRGTANWIPRMRAKR